MENNYYEVVVTRLIESAMWVNDNAKKSDINRNHVNYGCCTCWGEVLQDMGHKIDIPVYENDNGCLIIPSLKINGKKIINFEK